jgi:hypothetical protein
MLQNSWKQTCLLTVDMAAVVVGLTVGKCVNHNAQPLCVARVPQGVIGIGL